MDYCQAAYGQSIKVLLLTLLCLGISAALVWGPALTVAVGTLVLILLSTQIVGVHSKIDSAGILLLFLVIGTISFGRTFSYLAIRVEETTLYVTEAVLVAAWLLVVTRKMAAKERLIRTSGLNGLFLIYYALGAICLLRGVSEFGMEALRHSVIVYYSLFYFLILELITDEHQLERFLKFSLIGAAIAVAVIFYNFLVGTGLQTTTEVKRYGANIGALSLVLCMLFWLSLTVFGIRGRGRVLLSILLPFQLFAAVFLIQHRSLLVALIGGLLFILALVSKARTLKYLVLAIAVLLLIVGINQVSGVLSGNLLVKDTLARALSTLTPEKDPNSAHRMVMWNQILVRTAKQPLLGEGFGPPFSVFSGWKFYDYTERRLHPHNSFLWILNRMGIIGFGIFCFLILKFYSSGIRAYRRMNAGKHKAYLLAFLSSHFCISIFAFFNVVLEGPSMGISFWIVMGLTTALINIEKERWEKLNLELKVQTQKDADTDSGSLAPSLPRGGGDDKVAG
jgi:O-antigen ligase